jgi:RHS repeat-associated protein
VRFVSSTYDQENRLIRVTTANGNRSEFSYDGMSRRVETREYQANSLMLTTRYVYDGVLPLAELNGSNVTTRTITRGTDLSGSMQGAGGIGGILATNGNEYSYDGNGNVRDIISASGLNVAHYEYDPFGNKTVSSGSYSSQPYQWSSKEFHAPSGMVYYLYRFYSPQLGRWINRDPIEEAGGINLYGFVGNNGVSGIDPLGYVARATVVSAVREVLGSYLGGGTSYSFGPDHPWTKQIKEYSRVKEEIDSIAKEIQKLCCDLDYKNQGQFRYDSPQTKWSIPFRMLRDIQSPITGLGVAKITGSIGFNWKIDYAICASRNAKVDFIAKDKLSLASNFRNPITGRFVIPVPYLAFANDGEGSWSVRLEHLEDQEVNEPFGPNRPFNNIPLEWKWTETISY